MDHSIEEARLTLRKVDLGPLPYAVSCPLNERYRIEHVILLNLHAMIMLVMTKEQLQSAPRFEDNDRVSNAGRTTSTTTGSTAQRP